MILTSILNHFKTNKVLYIIIAALLTTMLIGHCVYKEKLNSSESLADYYKIKEKLEVQKQDSIINAKGEEIKTQKAVTTKYQDDINKITQENFNLKDKDRKNRDVIAYWKQIAQAKLDSVAIPYYDTIPVVIQGKDSAKLVAYIRDSTITVPRKSSLDTTGLKASFTITKKALVLDSLSITDTLDLAVTKIKGGFFKKDSYEFISKHSNPLLKSKKQQSLIYTPPKKNKLLGYIISAIVGAATALYFLK